MKTIVNTYLPIFPGFYSTIYESDDQESNEIYSINQDRKDKGLSELDWDQFEFDYKDYQNRIAEKCTDYIESILKNVNRSIVLNRVFKKSDLKFKTFDFVTSIKFECISSPKEYNFANDSIYIEVILTNKNIANIKRFINTHSVEFEKYIKSNFTSYDGFHSWYSNDVNVWLSKINDNSAITDQTQLGVLLEFICRNLGIEDIQIDMYYSCSDVYINCINYDEVTEKEFCNVCNEFVDIKDWRGNCCADCFDTNVQDLSIFVCNECKEQITNEHEVRSLLYNVQAKNILYSDIKCSDCQCNH